MAKRVSSDDIEKALWMMSSWRVDQDDVDRILGLVDQCIRAGRDAQCGQEGHVSCCGTGPAELELKRKTWTAVGVEQGRREAEPPAFTYAEIPECVLEAPERPSGALEPVEDTEGRTVRVRGLDGVVWLVAGTPMPTPGLDYDDLTHAQCTKCLLVRVHAEFSRDPSVRSGRRGACRVCEASAKRMRRKLAREAA